MGGNAPGGAPGGGANVVVPVAGTARKSLSRKRLVMWGADEGMLRSEEEKNTRGVGEPDVTVGTVVSRSPKRFEKPGRNRGFASD